MSLTVQQLAEAFATRTPAKSRTVRVQVDYDDDIVDYFLHDNLIAQRFAGGRLIFYWCGWYTPTTANHMKHIADACGMRRPMGYAAARDAGITTFQGEPR